MDSNVSLLRQFLVFLFCAFGDTILHLGIHDVILFIKFVLSLRASFQYKRWRLSVEPTTEFCISATATTVESTYACHFLQSR